MISPNDVGTFRRDRSSADRYLIGSGIVALVAGLLHLAIIFGGLAWYAFFRAPVRIVRMAAAGALYPTLFCLVAAALLILCASYAFSGAGLIRRLPLLRTGLVLIGSVFILRGLVLIPLTVLRRDVVAQVCNCNRIDPFSLLLQSSAWPPVLAMSLAPEKLRATCERRIACTFRDDGVAGVCDLIPVR